MPPQSPRIPTQGHPSASDDSGRHHRPESLADVRVRSGPRVAVTSLVEVPSVAAGRRRAADPATPRRAGRHQRPAQGGRHAVRPSATPRAPATGSHRAPGTLPIESWLVLGKTRQRAMLASLVAIGILLLAMPAEQRRDGIDAVNAAAQAVAGVQTEKKAPPPDVRDKRAPVAEKAPEKTATPKPSATVRSPAVEPTDVPTAPAKKDPGVGPGQSLRTTGSATVALTFDDGPDPVQTPRILELLGKYQVKAVFCLVGAQVRKHPDIVRQIVAEGHTLCNHTWDHSLTVGKDKPEEIKADLDRTNDAILAAMPTARIPFFRAPGGNFTDRLVGVAGNAGMTSLYWQVDPRDWQHPEKETKAQHIARVITDVREHVRPGSIVLSHDFNQPQTITAYEKLLPWLTENFTLGIPGVEAETPPTPTPEVSPSADS